jgi:hypothetical protein
MKYLNEIVEMESQINEINAKRFELRKSNDEKVAEILDSNFNYFKEVEIVVRGESAIVYLRDDEGKLKEIFSLYFDERYYKVDNKLRISYYSSSTNNEFELTRLIMLGNAAKIIKFKGERILEEIFEARKSNLERETELFSLQLKYENQIRDYQKENTAALKIQIELDLRSEEGITLSTPQTISLKRSYSPKIDKIRITEVKGKTCTVAIEMGGGSYKTTESRVNIEDLIDQIRYYVK